jgi:parallel beta-helix repeat protein
VARNNTATNNGTGGVGSGFEVSADNCRIAENTATDNTDQGIEVSSTNNQIANNEALNNGLDDLFDGNGPTCDANVWTNNTFGSANEACIN